MKQFTQESSRMLQLINAASLRAQSEDLISVSCPRNVAILSDELIAVGLANGACYLIALNMEGIWEKRHFDQGTSYLAAANGQFALGYHDGTVRVLNSDSLEVVWSSHVHEGGIQSIRFLGQQVFFSSYDGAVSCFDRDGVLVFLISDVQVNQLGSCCDGILMASDDGLHRMGGNGSLCALISCFPVYCANESTPEFLLYSTADGLYAKYPSKTIQISAESANRIETLSVGRSVVGFEDGKLAVFDGETLNPVTRKFWSELGPVVVQRNAVLVSGRHGPIVRYWNLDKQGMVSGHTNEPGHLIDVQAVPGGFLILTASGSIAELTASGFSVHAGPEVTASLNGVLKTEHVLLVSDSRGVVHIREKQEWKEARQISDLKAIHRVGDEHFAVLTDEYVEIHTSKSLNFVHRTKVGKGWLVLGSTNSEFAIGRADELLIFRQDSSGCVEMLGPFRLSEDTFAAIPRTELRNSTFVTWDSARREATCVLRGVSTWDVLRGRKKLTSRVCIYIDGATSCVGFDVESNSVFCGGANDVHRLLLADAPRSFFLEPKESDIRCDFEPAAIIVHDQQILVCDIGLNHTLVFEEEMRTQQK